MKHGFDKMLAFQAMTNVLRLGLLRRGYIQAIAGAMQDGLVTTTMSFHRELMNCEDELPRAIAICRRTAGKENAKKMIDALSAADKRMCV